MIEKGSNEDYNEIKKNEYPMEIFTIKRENNYNDDGLNYKNVSAKAIREVLKNKGNNKEDENCRPKFYCIAHRRKNMWLLF